jgi:hypothetical protein
VEEDDGIIAAKRDILGGETGRERRGNADQAIVTLGSYVI